MGIDINQYRAAIGTFSRNGPFKLIFKTEKSRKNKGGNYFKWVKFFLLFCLSFMLAVAEVNNIKIQKPESICIAGKHNLMSATIEVNGKIIEGRSINCCRTFFKKEEKGVHFYRFSNLDNHFSKYTNGNRNKNGIRICHFNKGGAFLHNRIHDIENIISQHRPHLLGISESNHFKGHDLESVQIDNYKMITSKTLDNPQLNVSRVCVYMHNSLVGKVRYDLMNDTFSSIWVEVGLPQKRKILIANVYREWGYLRQDNPGLSRDMSEQIKRWDSFLGQWERAMDEDKEVIVTGDVNLNHLEWTRGDLPPNNQTKKNRPLIDALFTRILPHGVSQLVTVASRAWPGQADSGLDHLYSNAPDKLSPIQVINCGISDHKLILTTRYATSIKRNVRYITKRCFKNFKRNDFLSEVRKINFWAIYQSESVDTALKLLNDSLTEILDRMAPIKTIQVREHYAPWLSNEIKEKMRERDQAQKIAAISKLDKDWKIYKRLRNNLNKTLKNEKQVWQRKKFQQSEDEKDSRQIWKNVKSWL